MFIPNYGADVTDAHPDTPPRSHAPNPVRDERSITQHTSALAHSTAAQLWPVPVLQSTTVCVVNSNPTKYCPGKGEAYHKTDQEMQILIGLVGNKGG